MKAYLEQIKRWWGALTPMERRWAVGGGMAAFLALNYFFVLPHFGDWARNSARIKADEATNAVYLAEIRHKTEYTRKLNELQSDSSPIPLEDQAIDFVRFYSSRMTSHQIREMSRGQPLARTNEFFIEQQMNVTVQGDETNLVKFLYSLGAGNSMMRIRSMTLHPDPSHMQLSASLTLVASYQKKAPERGKTASEPAAAPAKPPVVAAVAKTPAPAPAPAPARAPAPAPAAKPPRKEPKPEVGTNKLAGALARHMHTNHLNDATGH